MLNPSFRLLRPLVVGVLVGALWAAEALAQCPADCNGRGTCDPGTLACLCNLGSAGSACETCAAGFIDSGAACTLQNDSADDFWPNSVSNANSDPWLAVHHFDIRVMRPKVLPILFANPGSPDAANTLLNRIIAGLREGSRLKGFWDPTAQPQLEMELLPLIDLRDGVGGRPPAPAGWPYQNSTLFPRRPPGQPGYWRVDYAAFFSPRFAALYGYPDPDRPGQYLDLCSLVDRGLVHELWMVGSGDVSGEANAAEVLELKQRYTATRNKVPGSIDRCAGNGCFDPDVPMCSRSIKIGFVNYRIGPGYFIHSEGHGIESLGRQRDIPGLSDWLIPFMRFDLRSFGLPITDLYSMNYGNPCPGPQCVSITAPDRFVFTTRSGTYTLQPFDPVCGNVHFPPNGAAHYDYGATRTVSSSCMDFGYHSGPGGADLKSDIDSSYWAQYLTLASGSGGEFVVWWLQNMPGYMGFQTFVSGELMLPIWPALFY